MSTTRSPTEKTAAELFANLATESAALFRQEATLVTREMGDKAAVVMRQLLIVAVSLLLGTVSLMTLIASLVIGLSALVPAWASALIVGLAILAVAFGLYRKTTATISNLSPVPERTVRTLKETKSWLQQETR